MSLPTIPEILRQRAAAHGDRLALRFLRRGEHPEDEASYAALDRTARIVAGHLRAAGLGHGPVLVALPQGLDFVRCFLGCLYAGVIAIPTPALADPRGAERIAGIAAAARPTAIFAAEDAAEAKLWPELRARLPGLQLLTPAAILTGAPEAGLPLPAPEDIAFLQYTSGSTSRPKGVVITHGNIAANLEMIRDAFAQDATNSTVSWLPLHHDMGLIGCVLEPLVLGAQAVLMSPLAFLQRPARWLLAMDRFGATTAGAPNFAYELCARAVTEAQSQGLDLSRWRLAFCGAEPVRAATLARFAARFAPHGFQAEAFYPCYGQAEATLFVTGGRPGTGLRERLLPRGDGAPAIATVSCGKPFLGTGIALLDPAAPRHLPEGAVGEIAIAGPQVSPGFWDPDRGILPDLSREVSLDGRRYLRSGDLGAWQEGELHVVGRLKNMIILRGANIYAEDVERTAMALPAAAGLGAVAALAHAAPGGGPESLSLVCEAGRDQLPEAPSALLASLGEAVAQAHGVLPEEVVLLAAGGIERTLSGKLQRALTAQRLAAGELPVLARHRPPRAAAHFAP
jgi:acyl-CoA synthetase (AMP-forming)/AMP-acid ligase II